MIRSMTTDQKILKALTGDIFHNTSENKIKKPNIDSIFHKQNISFVKDPNFSLRTLLTQNYEYVKVDTL